MWGAIAVSTAHTFTETSNLTRRLVAHEWKVRGFQGSCICTRTRFGQSDHAISHIVMLVMVDTECPGGHSDCGGNDAVGTGSSY